MTPPTTDTTAARRTRTESSTGPTIDTIIMITARAAGLTPERLLGRSRLREESTARAVAAEAAERYLDATHAEIGRAMGGRDGSTITHLIGTLDDRIDAHPFASRLFDRVDRAVTRALTYPAEARAGGYVNALGDADIDVVICRVATGYGLARRDVTDPGTRMMARRAREIAIYLCHEHLGIACRSLADRFDLGSHESVLKFAAAGARAACSTADAPLVAAITKEMIPERSEH